MRKSMRLMIGAMLAVTPAAMATCEDGPSVVVGATYSTGLGERPVAPYLEARLNLGGWRLSGQGELSRKVESDRGYRLGADVERTWRYVILTGAYRHRDGGAWAKDTAWAGLGIGTQDLRLVVRREVALNGEGNDTASATLTLARGPVEWQGALYRYRPTFGGAHQVGSTLLLAFRY